MTRFVLLATATALLALLPGTSAQSPYKNCSTARTNISIINVKVNNVCIDAPCILKIGANATLVLTLEFNVDVATVFNKVEAQLGTAWIPYPIPSPDGCELDIKCPATKSTTPQQENVILPIPSFAPPIETVIRWSLWLDKTTTDRQLACILVEVKLEK